MATKNRIKLTRQFQKINSLIDGFDEELTYRMQLQSNVEAEFVESVDTPTLLPNGELPPNSGRVVVDTKLPIKWKMNGTDNLWGRVCHEGDNFLSVWEVE